MCELIMLPTGVISGEKKSEAKKRFERYTKNVKGEKEKSPQSKH